LIISVYFQHEDKKIKDQQRKAFINNLYNETSQTLRSMDILKNENQIKYESYEETKINIIKLIDLVNNASLFMDSSINYNISGGMLVYALDGIGSNSEVIIQPFVANSKPTKEQTLFLEKTINVLKKIKSDLYSSKTKQENPDLTIEEVNNIIEPLYHIFY